MKVDIRNIKVGDTISVGAVVAQIDEHDPEMPVWAEGVGWVLTEQIIGHTPRSFKVGDVVCLKNTGVIPGTTFILIHIENGFAWVKSSEGTPGQVVLLNDLVRA